MNSLELALLQAAPYDPQPLTYVSAVMHSLAAMGYIELIRAPHRTMWKVTTAGMRARHTSRSSALGSTGASR